MPLSNKTNSRERNNPTTSKKGRLKPVWDCLVPAGSLVGGTRLTVLRASAIAWLSPNPILLDQELLMRPTFYRVWNEIHCRSDRSNCSCGFPLSSYWTNEIISILVNGFRKRCWYGLGMNSHKVFGLFIFGTHFISFKPNESFPPKTFLQLPISNAS